MLAFKVEPGKYVTVDENNAIVKIRYIEDGEKKAFFFSLSTFNTETETSLISGPVEQEIMLIELENLDPEAPGAERIANDLLDEMFRQIDKGKRVFDLQEFFFI